MLLSRDWPLLGLLFARTSAGSVEVRVATQLAVPPADARAAWLDYAWARGGGLPGTATLLEDGGQSRTLLPVFLKERLVAKGYEIAGAAPTAKEIKEAKRKRDQMEEDDNGMDLSNIITGKRRRADVTYAPKTNSFGRELKPPLR